MIVPERTFKWTHIPIEPTQPCGKTVLVLGTRSGNYCNICMECSLSVKKESLGAFLWKLCIK